jgi:hypothetical protein
MLIRTEVLWGFVVEAMNGEAGRVRDLQVDDKRWVTRDIVTSTGHFLTSRLVLLNPRAVIKSDHVRQVLNVFLTTEQIASLPGIDAHPPVAQQEGVKPYDYLGLRSFCGGATPSLSGIPRAETNFRATVELRVFDPHLRSISELSHYRIKTRGGDAGRVVDWLIDDHGWVVYYAIVRTGSPVARKHVLVPVRWLGPVNWTARAIHADLEAGAIIHAPDYDPAAPPDPEYESRLRAWYGRPSIVVATRSATKP